MWGFLSRWGRELRDGAFQKLLISATVAGPNYLIAFLLLHGGLYRLAEWRQSGLTWPEATSRYALQECQQNTEGAANLTGFLQLI